MAMTEDWLAGCGSMPSEKSDTPTPRLVPDRPSASDKLRSLAAVIRQHGTCAPAALEYVAAEIDAAAPPAEAPAERGALQFTDATIDKLQDVMAVHGFAVPVRVISDAFRTALLTLAAAPDAPAEGCVADVARRMEQLAGIGIPVKPSCVLAWAHELKATAPRVTGGREVDDAAAERAARFICATCGEDWDSIGDFARGVLIENQRAALQAANGGEG